MNKVVDFFRSLVAMALCKLIDFSLKHNSVFLINVSLRLMELLYPSELKSTTEVDLEEDLEEQEEEQEEEYLTYCGLKLSALEETCLKDWDQQKPLPMPSNEISIALADREAQRNCNRFSKIIVENSDQTNNKGEKNESKKANSR